MYEFGQRQGRTGLSGSGMGLVWKGPIIAIATPFKPTVDAEEAARQAEIDARNAEREARAERRAAAERARPAEEAAAEQLAIEQRQARRAAVTTLGVGAGGLVIVGILGYVGYRWWKRRGETEEG